MAYLCVIESYAIALRFRPVRCLSFTLVILQALSWTDPRKRFAATQNPRHVATDIHVFFLFVLAPVCCGLKLRFSNKWKIIFDPGISKWWRIIHAS